MNDAEDDQDDEDDEEAELSEGAPRPEVFAPLPNIRGQYVIGLIACAVLIPLLWFKGDPPRTVWLALLPAWAIAPLALRLLYVSSVRVRFTPDGVLRSWRYGSRFLPYSEIKGLDWVEKRGAGALRISGKRRRISCAEGLFGVHQLDLMREEILARLPGGEPKRPLPEASGHGRRRQRPSHPALASAHWRGCGLV